MILTSPLIRSPQQPPKPPRHPLLRIQPTVRVPPPDPVTSASQVESTDLEIEILETHSSEEAPTVRRSQRKRRQKEQSSRPLFTPRNRLKNQLPRPTLNLVMQARYLDVLECCYSLSSVENSVNRVPEGRYSLCRFCIAMTINSPENIAIAMQKSNLFFILFTMTLHHHVKSSCKQ
jgi:hypothetical protein